MSIFSATSIDLAVLPLDRWPCWRLPGSFSGKVALNWKFAERVDPKTIGFQYESGGFLDDLGYRSSTSGNTNLKI